MAERERGDTKDHPLSQWFLNFSEADELLKLAAARQQVGISYFLLLNRSLSTCNTSAYEENILLICYYLNTMINELVTICLHALDVPP